MEIEEIASTAEMPQAEELLPPAGDIEVGYSVFRMLEEVLKSKSDLRLPEKWTKFYDMSRNRYWDAKQTRTGVQLLSANLMFAHRQRTCNMLTNNNPTFNVARIGAAGEAEEEIADRLLKAAEYWWSETEQQHILERSVINGEMYGCTVEKTLFNPDLEFGLGEVETEVIDPYYFGVFPPACQDIQKAEAVFHFQVMTVREARRRWPEFADQLSGDEDALKELGDTRTEVANASRKDGSVFSTMANVSKLLTEFVGAGSGSGSDNMLVVECWCKDYTDGEDGLPLYPGFIRCVTCCIGGKVVLSDRPNPSINPMLPMELAIRTYLYDKYPFTITSSVTDTGSIWGMSDYEHLSALQQEINKTIAQVTHIKDRVSRTKIINPKDSGVPNSHFTNAPGILNPANANVAAGIRYMDPPEIPSDLLNLLPIYKELFFQIAGEFDMEQAQAEGRQVIAYKAIAALIERASTMMQGKIRNYGKMTRERGRMYISHLQNWYTEERWISYDTDDGKVSAPVVGPDMIVPAKLTVVSGSTMPRSKVQEREEALEMFKSGAIDNEELLKRMDWPDRKTVVKRMKAGPFGVLWERMQELGAPPELTEILNEMALMDEKEFDRAAEQGKIPSIPQLLQAIAGQAQGMQETPLDNAEIQLKMAETQKVVAETELTKAKVATELVEQEVKRYGVAFDGEKLNIEKAQALNQIEMSEQTHTLSKAQTLHQIDKDNRGSELQGKSAEKGSQGPYREKGMKSNNTGGA